MNGAAEKLLGYSRAELIGRDAEILVPETLRALHAGHSESFMERLAVGEQAAIAGIPLRRADGETIRVDFTISPIGVQGERGIDCIARETRLSRAEEARLRRHAESQEALAALGRRALATESLEALFEDAVTTLAGVLDVEFCKVLELLPDGETLLLAAGVGWREGLVGRATLGTELHSQAGFTLSSDESVIVADLRSEARFSGPPLLTEHAVVSGMSAIIRGMKGPWGVLGAHTVRRRDFHFDEVQFLQSIANLLGMAVEREHAEEARRESEERMRASQRLEAIGRLAGGIAHDFNNILLVIMNSAEMLEEEGAGEEAKAISSAAVRAAALTQQLLTFSRRQILEPRILDVDAEISGMEQMLRRLLGEDVELVMNLAADGGRVQADPSQIHQIILNLAINARDALPDGGKLEIETARSGIGSDGPRTHASAGPASCVAIRVSDTGIGMDADTRSKSFEPFFTTKGDSGTGLGLATVYGIVKQSGGSIRIESETGQGTRFEILLPEVVEPLDASVEAGGTLDAPHGVETVLVVEDDEAVRRMICRGLRDHGYDVLEAGGPAEALEIGARHRGAIALLVTDMVMPGMRGSELIGRLRAARPGLPALVVSGYANASGDESWRTEPNTALLAKPFASARLARKVREMLDAARPAHASSPAGRRRSVRS